MKTARPLALAALLTAPGSAATVPSIQALLEAHYLNWTPYAGDSSPLAALRTQGVLWADASGLFASLYDEPNSYAELRGLLRLPDGRTSLGVTRAALFRQGQNGVLAVNEEWCAGLLCRARTRFYRLEAGRLGPVLADAQLIPRITDRDLLVSPVPECLNNVPLGVQYLPSRYGPTLTVLAVLPPAAEAECELAGVNPALATRPLVLTWNAAARRFRR